MMKNYQQLFLIGFSLYSSFLLAHEPNLTSITTSNQTSTTVTMTGGATNSDDGETYQTEFIGMDAITLGGTINIPAEEQGQMASTYIFLNIVGIAWFQLDTNGIFILWDENFANLGPARINETLSAQHAVPVISNIIPGQHGLAGLNYELHIGYSLNSDPDRIIYNGDPIVANVGVFKQSQSLYMASITSTIQSKCLACHVENGVAGLSELHYESSANPNYLSVNYQELADFINNVPGGSSSILTKPTGVAHAGGVQMDSGSTEHNNLSDFSQLVRVGS